MKSQLASPLLGGQHDGHLSFWLPSFVKLIMLLLHVLFAY